MKIKHTSEKWKELIIFDNGINKDMLNSNDIERAHRNLRFKMIDQYGNEVSGYIGSVHPRFISLFKSAPKLLGALKAISKCKRGEGLPVNVVIKMMEAITEAGKIK